MVIFCRNIYKNRFWGCRWVKIFTEDMDTVTAEWPFLPEKVFYWIYNQERKQSLCRRKLLTICNMVFLF